MVLEVVMEVVVDEKVNKEVNEEMQGGKVDVKVDEMLLEVVVWKKWCLINVSENRSSVNIKSSFSQKCKCTLQTSVLNPREYVFTFL